MSLDQIKELEKLIKYHNTKYFIDNAPEIEDKEFDLLVEELNRLDVNNPAIYEIVGDIGSVEHNPPMLSLDKKYTYEDIKKWVDSIGDNEYLVQPKYDGMAAKYEKGILSTRGNGKKGEDITQRLEHLNIKGTLSDLCYGEIIITNTYFKKHLSQKYKNPRNAVVGIVKAKRITKEGVKALKEGGVHFVIHDTFLSKTYDKENLLKNIENILNETVKIDYPLDGVVIKATNKKLIKNLGSTSHHPRWAVAFKFESESKWSKVIDIIDSVGRTGRVTAIAKIKPIQLSGATVTNVTLHNYAFVKTSGINLGSKVLVKRAGEVIPFIMEVNNDLIEDKNDKSENHNLNRKYEIPTNCPECNTKLIYSGKYLECNNTKCPVKLSQGVAYFFKSLDVEEIAITTIEKFIKQFKLSSILDFYTLKKEQISDLEGFGEKSANTIVDNINSTLKSTISPEQLLKALGIKEIGGQTASWILGKYRFENLINLKPSDLELINGMGPRKSNNFINSIKDKWYIYEGLKKLGFNFKIIEKNKDFKNSKIFGKSFCITGKKETLSRNDLIRLIKDNGGIYKSSITKDLNYLIAGEDAGSKLKKAQSLNIKILNEKRFLEML